MTDDKLRAALDAYIAWQYRQPGAKRFTLTDLRASLAAAAPDEGPRWRCDWVPDELNPGPECPYCAGDMCARMDNLNCRHNRIERHGYPARPAAPALDVEHTE